MLISIESVENGYICTCFQAENEKPHFVFEVAETERGELEAMQGLLRFVSEHFGIVHSKHNKCNLNIEIVENEDAL